MNSDRTMDSNEFLRRRSTRPLLVPADQTVQRSRFHGNDGKEAQDLQSLAQYPGWRMNDGERAGPGRRR